MLQPLVLPSSEPLAPLPLHSPVPPRLCFAFPRLCSPRKSSAGPTAKAAFSPPSCVGSDSKQMKKTVLNGTLSVPPMGLVSPGGWCSQELLLHGHWGLQLCWEVHEWENVGQEGS